MRILPVVKAYPVVDQVSFSEAVCVAGIDMDEPHRWVRLFPLDFRGLEHVQRFRKYETITLEANRSSKDSRPESYAPVLGSIEVGEHIGTDGGTWQRRMSFFDAIEDESMCEIQRRQKTDRQSLGVFRPESVCDLVVSPAPREFEASQRAIIEQGSLFGDRAGDKQRTTLEPLPVKAKFKYRCSEGSCDGHEQSFIDWELGALYRRMRDDEGYGQDACLTAVREKFLHYCDETRDVRFIAGSMLRHPGSFLILGLVYPKRKPLQQRESLF